MTTTVSMTQEEFDALPKYIDAILTHKATERVKLLAAHDGPNGPEVVWFLVSTQDDGRIGDTMQRIEVLP